MPGGKGHPTASLKPWAKIDSPPFIGFVHVFCDSDKPKPLWSQVPWSNSLVLHFFWCLSYTSFRLLLNWAASDPLVLALCCACRSPISACVARQPESTSGMIVGLGITSTPLFIWRQTISTKDPDLSPTLRGIDFNHRYQVQSVLNERLKPGNRRCVEASTLSSQGALAFAVLRAGV